MNKEQFNQQSEELVAKGKTLVAEGNKRSLVFYKKDGDQLFETSVTVAAGVGLLALVTGFLTFPVIVIAGLAMYFTKTRVELHHEQ